jgi:hypothetical protein
MSKFDEKTGLFIAKPIGTQYFIETKEQYLEIIDSWKAHVNSKKTIYSCHLMLYNILRSKSYDKGFTPVTKKLKLDNGQDKWFGLKNAAYQIRAAAIYGGSYLKFLCEPFGEKIAAEDIKKAWALIEKDARLK